MYEILSKESLNPTVSRMVIQAPLVAAKAQPGQFIIVRPNADSERIPLTIAGYDREKPAPWTSSSRSWAAPRWS
jgi:ferredoxin--NADP+ reductase